MLTVLFDGQNPHCDLGKLLCGYYVDVVKKDPGDYFLDGRRIKPIYNYHSKICLLSRGISSFVQ